MFRSIVVGLAVAGALLAARTDAFAAAPSAPTYAGGQLPARGASLGVALQPRGGQIAVRFDTELRCAGRTLDLTARRVMPFDGADVAARAAFAVSAGARRRVTGTWALAGRIAGTSAAGTLQVSAAVRAGGGRGVRCTPQAERAWRARLVAAPAGAPAAPAPGATLVGGTAQAVEDGLPGAVVVRVAGNGRRATARFSAVAPCPRGPAEPLAHTTPARAPRGNALRSTERFRVRTAGAVRRYRTDFTARFAAGGASGTVRLRVDVLDAGGRRVRARCDSGTQTWAALPAVDPASPPAAPPSLPAMSAPPATAGAPGAATGAPAPESVPARVVETDANNNEIALTGTWRLSLASDPGDFVGGGGSWDVGPPDNALTVHVGPGLVSFFTSNAALPGFFWSGGFGRLGAPTPDPLAPGIYGNARRLDPSAPSLDVGGMGHGCNMTDGAFIVDEAAYDASGFLRAFVVRFEQHCDGATPALRGTFSFHAA